MDIASLIGLIGGIGMILGAMISGGGIAPFVDVPSILIVFGARRFWFYTLFQCLFFWVISEQWQKPLCHPLKKWMN